MRLPWSKIHRAFPELDPFSDEECQRYILQVRIQRNLLVWPSLLATGVALLWLFVIFPAIGITAAAMHLRMSDGLGFALAAGVVTLSAGTTMLALLALRDAMLIRGVRRRLELARCTRCRQSLLGLPLLPAHTEDAVRCPECGAVMVLAELGLRYAELIPRSE